ncbi:ribulose-phosphate 3-epimerase, partial [Listeria monocytogenes]|nr:ribulose-phosphate 3-epimerase [Listeria monocytogenes]
GVNAETAEKCKQAGVDVLVAGSYFFRADDKIACIKELKA